ncbi:uncharacterized protein P884DRAFT_91145 [Thermothelomyces heterothallicus CBS 202.75]|uniref:uncharacterized protein n=1 Tax=Thermothelomyces heterothallicus CBS 202.75 TaxID=1149848 RepID=UPI003743DBF7
MLIQGGREEGRKGRRGDFSRAMRVADVNDSQQIPRCADRPSRHPWSSVSPRSTHYNPALLLFIAEIMSRRQTARQRALYTGLPASRRSCIRARTGWTPNSARPAFRRRRGADSCLCRVRVRGCARVGCLTVGH